MRIVPTDHPKTAPDIKLEQTIQRSNNSSGFVIRQTSNKNFVNAWELASHEISSISNVLQNIINGVIDFRDTDSHHEFRGNLYLELNLGVIKVVYHINSNNNPFIVSSETKRYNLSTGQIVSDNFPERIRCFYDSGKGKYIEYRQEQYI